MKYSSYVLVLIIGLFIGLQMKSLSQIQAPSSQKSESSTKASGGSEEESSVNPQHIPLEDEKLIISQLSKPTKLLTTKEEFEAAMAKSDYERAWQVVKKLEAENNQSPEYLESASRLLVRTRKWDEAKEILKDCLSHVPKSRSCAIDMASTELQLGTKQEQEAAVRNCLASFPDEPQCQNMEGITKLNQGQYAEAISIYQKLIEKNGDHGFRFDEPMLDWQLGLALEKSGNTHEAVEHYRKACEGNFATSCEKVESLSKRL